MAKVTELLLEIKAKTDGLEKGLQSVVGDMGSFSTKLRDVGVTIFAWAEAAKLAVGAVQKAYGALFGDMADYAEDVNRISSRLGISTDAVQKLTFAIQVQNGSAEDLSTGLKALALNIYQAGQGAEKEAKIFQALGISILDSSGKIKSADKVLLEFSDVLAKSALPQTEKMALAQELLGRSGVNLLPIIQQGSQAIQGYGQALEQVGGIVSQKTVAAFDLLDKSWKLVSASARGFTSAIAEEVLPWIQKLADWLIDIAPMAQAGFRELISGASDFASSIGGALEGYVSTIWNYLKGSFNSIKAWISDLYDEVVKSIQEIEAFAITLFDTLEPLVSSFISYFLEGLGMLWEAIKPLQGLLASLGIDISSLSEIVQTVLVSSVNAVVNILKFLEQIRVIFWSVTDAISQGIEYATTLVGNFVSYAGKILWNLATSLVEAVSLPSRLLLKLLTVTLPAAIAELEEYALEKLSVYHWFFGEKSLSSVKANMARLFDDLADDISDTYKTITRSQKESINLLTQNLGEVSTKYSEIEKYRAQEHGQVLDSISGMETDFLNTLSQNSSLQSNRLQQISQERIKASEALSNQEIGIETNKEGIISSIVAGGVNQRIAYFGQEANGFSASRNRMLTDEEELAKALEGPRSAMKESEKAFNAAIGGIQDNGLKATEDVFGIKLQDQQNYQDATQKQAADAIEQSRKNHQAQLDQLDSQNFQNSKDKEKQQKAIKDDFKKETDAIANAWKDRTAKEAALKKAEEQAAKDLAQKKLERELQDYWDQQAALQTGKTPSGGGGGKGEGSTTLVDWGSQLGKTTKQADDLGGALGNAEKAKKSLADNIKQEMGEGGPVSDALQNVADIPGPMTKNFNDVADAVGGAGNAIKAAISPTGPYVWTPTALAAAGVPVNITNNFPINIPGMTPSQIAQAVSTQTNQALTSRVKS